MTNDQPKSVATVGEIVVINRPDTPTAIQQITMGEVDSAITTARQYPRDIERFKETALAIATADEETAGLCGYKVPKGKGITGPSVRLAEILAQQYGNLRFGARVIEVGEKFVVAQGVAHDLETNVAITIDVSRSIWGNSGRYGQDMINVTMSAALAIAFRNAIFKVIPQQYTKAIYGECMRVAGGGETRQNPDAMRERRSKLLQYYKGLGVSELDVLVYLKRSAVDKIDADQIDHLRGIAVAIQEHQTSVASVFRPGSAAAEVEPPEGEGTDDPLLSDDEIDGICGKDTQ